MLFGPSINTWTGCFLSVSSVHEMGFYDISALCDFILKKTRQKKLNYIGYSLGGNKIHFEALQRVFLLWGNDFDNFSCRLWLAEGQEYYVFIKYSSIRFLTKIFMTLGQAVEKLWDLNKCMSKKKFPKSSILKKSLSRNSFSMVAFFIESHRNYYWIGLKG